MSAETGEAGARYNYPRELTDIIEKARYKFLARAADGGADEAYLRECIVAAMPDETKGEAYARIAVAVPSIVLQPTTIVLDQDYKQGQVVEYHSPMHIIMYRIAELVMKEVLEGEAEYLLGDSSEQK